jgi:predicted secreted protein
MSEKLSSKVGNKITIELISNPSTGYQWIAEFDPKIIELIKEDFQPSSKLLGAGGIERFEFGALSSGVTNLKMVYKRGGEDSFTDEKNFQICIE